MFSQYRIEASGGESEHATSCVGAVELLADNGNYKTQLDVGILGDSII